MATGRVGSKALIRELNEVRVISEIRRAGSASRTELVRATGLSAAAITGIVGRLLERGLLIESSTGASTGGRPQTMLTIRVDWGVIVGAKVTEHLVTAVLTDLHAAVLAEVSLPVGDPSVGTVTATIAGAVEELASSEIPPVRGVGVGMAGIVDHRSGTIRQATYFHWRDEPLGSRLAEMLDVPVALDNDVNTMALAEQLWGAAREVQDFVLISLGRGIGMALVTDGALHRGADGGAGELGHVIVAPDGPECACGLVGCLEAVAGEPALVARLEAVVGRSMDIEEGTRRARAGDARLAAVFDEAGTRIGAALATVVQLVNPRLVVVAGEGALYADLLMPSLQARLDASVGSVVRPRIVVDAQGWDARAWARGAASLVLSQMYQPDLLDAPPGPSARLVG